MDDANALLSRFMLALCVYREASNQSFAGKLLVAQVIRNRVEDKRWPSTYVGVITQKLQFSSFNANDPNNSRWPKDNDAAWLECVEAADAVLAAPADVPPPFSVANHYHTKAVKPSWADETKITQVEGDHIFYDL